MVNSGPCDFWTPTTPVRNALYKNNRDGTFTDVTVKAGVTGGNFGMGVVVGDYDNDGWPDLFVTSYGRAILYHNNQRRHVHRCDRESRRRIDRLDHQRAFGLTTTTMAVSIYFCAISSIMAPLTNLNAATTNSAATTIAFRAFSRGTTNFLYHNNGDGTFTEVSKGTDIAKAIGKGLGVVATDINNDGRMDLFVANDTVQNFLFANRGPDKTGKWQFEEIALQAEVGFSDNGQPRSGMGVDAADINNDGWQDLFVANVDQEMYSLYINGKTESFRDAAHLHGVAQATRLLSGWGLKFFDYDNDGALDLILANGHPDDMIDSYSQQVRYKEPLLLFHQRTDGKLFNVSDQGGPAFQKMFPARGLAIGDYDNDGALDVLIGNNGGAPVLLHNRAARGTHWLGIKLEGVTCNRDAIGTKLIWKAGGKTFRRLKNSGGSYLSSHDPREILGIGEAKQIDELEIHWALPSQKVEKFSNLPVDRYVHIVEGKGIV